MPFPATCALSECLKLRVQSTQKTTWISWKWTLIISAIAVTFLMWQCGSGLLKGRGLANAAVRHFHSQLNEGLVEQICSDADAGFQQVQGHDETVKFLQGVHTKLGLAQSEKLTYMTVNATTGGTFLTTVYQTTFDRGLATETFTWLKTISGNGLKLRGYNIQSNAFIVN